MQVICPTDGKFTSKKPDRQVQKLRFVGDLEDLPPEVRPDSPTFLTEDKAREYAESGWAATSDWDEVTVDVHVCPKCGSPIAVEQ